MRSLVGKFKEYVTTEHPDNPWLGKEIFHNCSSLKIINIPRDCVDYYKEVLPEEFHDKIVELEPEKRTKVRK